MASIRVLGVHSSKTVSAIRRIADILKPAGIHIVNGQLQHANDYDYILANNIGVPSRYRHKTILYLCSAATSQFMRFHTREDLRNNPYKAIWVNCNSGRLLLEKKGVESELMYRPNKLTFPERYHSPTRPEVVLFYWKARENHPHHKYRHFCKRFLLDTNSVKFLMFPTQHPIVDAPHVSAIGHLSRRELHELLEQVAGMVRITPAVDFGRVTFDLLSYGRWCIYYNMQEKHIHNLLHLELYRLQRLLITTMKEDSPQAVRRMEYTRNNFSEELLTVRWSAKFRKVFKL